MRDGRRIWNGEFKQLSMASLIETSPPSSVGKLWVSPLCAYLNIARLCLAGCLLGAEDSVALFGPDHEFTKLVIDLKGKDPDDAFSSIPYEKGFHFLYYLEKVVGKTAFDKFIPHYFTTWQKKSLDSYEFKSTLLEFFESDKDASKALGEVDWDSWFYKPGLPPKPKFDTSMVDKCYALADKWESQKVCELR
jgi:hypothetical protein